MKICFQCNNLCEFCVQGDKRERLANKSLEEIKKALREARQENIEGVVFTGGEPTVHPDILKVVEYAQKAGFKSIQLQTNGRMFSYLDFCKKIISAGASEFSPALHSSVPEIHDKLTNSPGAWQQVVKGIRNLKSLNQYVLTNTVITSLNYKDFPELAKLFVRLNVDQFQFAYVHIIGTAFKNKEWLIPRKSEVMPYVRKGLDIGIFAGKKVMTEAIPYCFMSGYEDYIAEKNIPETKVVAENTIDDFNYFRKNVGKLKSATCKICGYYNICEGPWKEYPEIFGWDEFKPVIKLPPHFEKLENYDKKLIQVVGQAYNLGEIVAVYKYVKRSINNAHLFVFQAKIVIAKLSKTKTPEKINAEQNVLSIFLKKGLLFPAMLKTVKGDFYLKYKQSYIRLYEYVQGSNNVHYFNYLDKILNYFIFCVQSKDKFNKFYNREAVLFKLDKKIANALKLTKKFNHSDNKYLVGLLGDSENILNNIRSSDVIIPLHFLELVLNEKGLYFLESEHLIENFFPSSYVLARYILKVLTQENQILNIDELVRIVFTKTNLAQEKKTAVNLLLTIDLLRRIYNYKKYNKDTRNKYKKYYRDLIIGFNVKFSQ